MNISLLLYLLFVVAPIGTVLHEAGHVLGAKSLKADHVRLTIGSGTIVNTFIIRKVQVRIRAIFFLGGSASSERKNMYKPSELIWIALCGPLTNGFIALLLYILYMIYPSSYLLLLLLFNLWIAIINLVPFRFKEKQSDGYAIVKVLTKR
ncbi:site-2 protease family protein [Virgibacillus litoralis]|uniref:Zn-dependent protease n=1 Tax=Virgibacillus litoralis TaxID=578221 RepID=A0ABS4HFX4_9BACI|nr:site-2 protease family protein [Virgibacillus litoralis]MBP1949514.1 Zn-dependent protease [Virgibacillus litoralis]